MTQEAGRGHRIAQSYKLGSIKAGIPTRFSPKPLLERHEAFGTTTALPCVATWTVHVASHQPLLSSTPPFLAGPAHRPGGKAQCSDLLACSVLPPSPRPRSHAQPWHDGTTSEISASSRPSVPLPVPECGVLTVLLCVPTVTRPALEFPLDETGPQY